MDLLLLVSRVIKFATEHPYAATGILGAAVGSAATYSVMAQQADHRTAQAVGGKVYEIALSEADLDHMQVDPTARLRYEFPLISVVVHPEEKVQPLMLPDIIIDPPE